MQSNILFIFCDQFRADCLSHLGHPDVQTPHLDQLAAEGVSFANTITQCPLCVPARMSLFSGRYVHQHGCRNNGAGLWPEEANMVRAVRDAGYHTANRGKLHLFWRHDNELLMSGPMLQRFGFDDPLETSGKCSAGRLRASAYSEHLRNKGLMQDLWSDLWERVRHSRVGVTYGRSILENEDDHVDGWVLNQTMDAIDRAQNCGKPFFIWSGPPGPHDPFDPPGEWANMYEPNELNIGIRQVSENKRVQGRSAGGEAKMSEERVLAMRAMYYGNISFIDHKIGQLVDKLKRDGLYDSTWVIMSADHGEMLGDFYMTTKATFHDAAVRVPLIIKPPAALVDCSRGTISNALVELIDVGTTIRSVAGGALPGDHGRSLLPILQGEVDPDSHRETAHSQINDTVMVCTRDRKLVLHENGKEVYAFHDLTEDPQERHNYMDDRPDEVRGFLDQHVVPFFARTRQKLQTPWKDQMPFTQWGRNPLLDVLV